jgi:hypothetical protein
VFGRVFAFALNNDISALMLISALCRQEQKKNYPLTRNAGKKVCSVVAEKITFDKTLVCKASCFHMPVIFLSISSECGTSIVRKTEFVNCQPKQ